MKIDQGPQKLSDLFNKPPSPKPPAHQWQDLALRIIAELSIPSFKRSAVFKACRDYPKEHIERCLNDTKELCKSGVTWKYFFKVLAAKPDIEKPDAIKKEA